MVELLGQPDLADTRGENAASLIDDVVDGVDRRRAPMKNYSGGHVRDNPPGRRSIPFTRRARKFGVTLGYASPGSAADQLFGVPSSANFSGYDHLAGQARGLPRRRRRRRRRAGCLSSEQSIGRQGARRSMTLTPSRLEIETAGNERD